MAQRTITQFKALYGSSGTLFPDNTTGEISEGDVRAFGEDIADSFSFQQYFRGAYDASGNTYPASGGSGVSGAIKAGDEWYFSVAGTLDGGLWPVKTIAKALIDTPGQTDANWRLY
jgi:hypothetical protein